MPCSEGECIGPSKVTTLPVQSTQSGQSTSPGQQTQPSQNTTRGQQTQPGQTITPGQNTTPGQQTQPGEPVWVTVTVPCTEKECTSPSKVTTMPVQSIQSSQSTSPGQQTQPVQTTAPGQQTQPGQTTTPGQQTQPGGPVWVTVTVPCTEKECTSPSKVTTIQAQSTQPGEPPVTETTGPEQGPHRATSPAAVETSNPAGTVPVSNTPEGERETQLIRSSTNTSYIVPLTTITSPQVIISGSVTTTSIVTVTVPCATVTLPPSIVSSQVPLNTSKY